ncbi:Erlin-2 [Hibiscus syriacus]|uniref:Erlin-2 n=1 Tax=Hibiscus syriacus TaxID=106335 RepID=A0A6A3CZM3_HIBSY|nr:Erlin-2 [Hibiscus syriacus]
MDPPPHRAAPPSPPPAQGCRYFPILFVVVFIFMVIDFLAMAPTCCNPKNTLSVLHQVPEGHVGVYWKGGALLKTITEPGFHLKMPLITRYEPVLVTLQTDQVRDIPCGTKGGVMINFEKIEVVNKLRKEYVYETLLNYGVHYDNTWIYDKIHHEINQFCSSHTLQQVYIDVFDQIDEKMKDALQGDCTKYAPGIEILSVRVTKPTIPESIRRNYEQMEEERTKVLISMERQKVAEKESETQKIMAISEAEKDATVSKILMEHKLVERESSMKLQEIENQMFVAREKSRADAELYRAMKEAEANKSKLSREFLHLKFTEAIANNTKIFFGDKAANMVLDQTLIVTWAFVGLSVTEVITASITVVIGSTLNYFLDGKINRAEVLFPGVVKQAELNNLETGNGTTEKAKVGTAEFLLDLENRRAMKVFGKSTLIDLSITFFACICFSLFSPAFNLATNDQWHTLKGVPHLVVYTAFFYFPMSCFALALILNVTFLYRPVLGAPRSSFKAYLNDGNGRGWAFLAWILCGFGNSL